ncbi:uncharacterized protein LOC141649085 [Silene latifolia]|uniref:uncharacterized protein LOC141649085 n=1 Tax=Silene latifolia TaxID=37657 RepID=UPI003D77834A
MAKWSVHLSGYDLKFEPRTAIKSQTLADFVSDFSPALQPQADKDVLILSEDKGDQRWVLYVDGASNMRGTSVGLVLRSPKGEHIVYAVRCEFKATNNEAEYEALILGLQLALDLRVSHIEVYNDSRLILNHVNDLYVARDSKMVAFLKVAKDLKLRFATCFTKQIPRDQNAEANALATLGVTFKPGIISIVPIIHVLEPAICQQEHEGADKGTYSQWTHEVGVMCTSTAQDETPDWRQSYHDWLQNDVLPADKKEVRSFKVKASSGECGNHARGWCLSNKALRQGYFWPTKHKEAMEYVNKCDACQRHAPISHQPAEPMHPIISPWLFMKWGMNIVGPQSRASGNRVYMLAMTNYFSKWIEVEAFPQVLERHVISFFKRNIIRRFGIPSEIVCDNGSQFVSDIMEAFYARWNIALFKSTPRNSQSSGQAESSNKIVMENLKKRLEEIGGKWADEFPPSTLV